MNVYQRLNDAREKFHKLELKKSGHNKFAGYHYFELSDFLIPALRVFSECGLCAVVSFEKELARMTIHCVDDPGQCITVTSPMGGAALKGCHEVQNIGAVETYQRRYLWVVALEIVEHDALDATTGQPDKAPQNVKAPKNGAVGDYLRGAKIADARAHALDMLAETVIGDHDGYGASAACERLESEGLEEQEKVYLWSKLPANVRRAIKTHQEEKATT